MARVEETGSATVSDDNPVLGAMMDSDKNTQQAEKMESLSLLAGGIAHDFNNLLMTILGNTDLAISMIGHSSSELRGYLEEVQSASGRAADLCRLLLAYSGKGRFELDPVDLTSLVQSCKGDLQEDFTSEATLEIALAPDLELVRGNPTQLRRALQELLSNATESLGEDGVGQVQVSTSRALSNDPWIQDALGSPHRPSCSYNVLEVSDNGSGMNRATKERAFDPFFTTKGAGRGLGLATVLGIVRGHSALVHVDSSPEVGTRTRIYIPALAAEETAGAPQGSMQFLQQAK